MDYSKSVSGPTGWQPSTKGPDQGHMRYPNDDRKPSELSDYSSSRDASRLPSGSNYPSNQNTEATRPMLASSGFPSQPSYSQSDYLYPASVKPNNDEFNSSGQSSSFALSQPRMAGSALKQPDSQATGATKKSVTFNENIGVTEYTINRSYGSTSSESSFPHSPEQSTGSRPSSDQPPVPPPATYLAAIRPSSTSSNPPQQQQPYEPSYLQPSYSQHGRVAEQPSYPYIPSNEPRYSYGNQNPENVSQPSVALPYRPSAQDQSQFSNRNNSYAPDHRYPGQSAGGRAGGGAGGSGYYPHHPQAQYNVRPVHPLYSHSQEPVAYGRQQQQMKEGSLEGLNPLYVPGGGGGASVIGAQEVYRDPRDRILASKAGPGMP